MIRTFLFFAGLVAGAVYGRITSASSADWYGLALFWIVFLIVYWKDYLTKLIAYYKEKSNGR